MTLEEFQEKYCALCGTQRCFGVYDEEFREGCQHYREVFLHGARMDAEKLQDNSHLIKYHLSCPECGRTWWSEEAFPKKCPYCGAER